MLPLYIWIAIVVGRYHDKPWNDPWGIVLFTAVVVLGAMALADFVGLLFRGTVSHSIFRLAVVNANGQPAARSHLLVRWAIAWMPLFLPMSLVALLARQAEGVAVTTALVLLLLWLGAAVHTVVHPHRGWHDRLAGTWVVRR
jgi:uncharacterized RDD family membrane protein YckC